MVKSKKQMFLTITIFTLIMILGTVSYAFFNYTRTGTNNNVRVGRVNFLSSENNTINLTDVFPTDSSHLDSTNSSTVTVNITGDTNYDKGIEYKVSIVDVQNIINNKEVPISFSVTASNLGTKSSGYYNERGSTTNVYNLRETGVAEEGQDIVIGYIKPDENGINGSINITAFIDADGVGISDTVSRIVNDNLVYGETDAEWIAGRTILTTSEWNSLATNGISFKVNVEANEGIWVQETKRHVLSNFYSNSNWANIRNKVTSIEFHKDGIAPENAITSFDATDLTSEGPVTVYALDDGLGNDTYKAVIVADDVIYAPVDSKNIFRDTQALTTFNSNNFKVDYTNNLQAAFYNSINLVNIDSLDQWNVSNVRNMTALFYNCNSITNVDPLLNWNVSNVSETYGLWGMFAFCESLANINGLANWDVSSITNTGWMFKGCASLRNINSLANWNVSNVVDMSDMFASCSSLKDIDGLKKWNTSKVTSMSQMFIDCKDLEDVSGLKNWNVEKVTTTYRMFRACINLEEVDFSKWKTSSLTNMEQMFGMYNNDGSDRTDSKLRRIIASNLFDTSKVTTMKQLFANDVLLSNVSFLQYFDTSSVTNMHSLFYNCQRIEDMSAIYNWNTSNVTTMYRLFAKCSNIKNLDLSSWNMLNLSTDQAMFENTGFITLTMPNNYTRIDSFMYNHNFNYSGSSFTIPSSVTTIGNSHVFYDFGLDGTFNKFIVESGSTAAKTVDDILYSYDGTRLISVPRGKTFTNNTFEIPEGVIFMNELSFSRNQNIDTLVLPNSYVIERYIDKDNNNYGFINTGNSLSLAIYGFTTISRYEVKNDNPRYSSDSGCIYSKDGTELIAVPLHYSGVLNIKAGTTSIGQEAFWTDTDAVEALTGITQINIPASVTTIEARQLTILNTLMLRSTNPVTITIDSGNTSYQISNNQIVAR